MCQMDDNGVPLSNLKGFKTTSRRVLATISEPTDAFEVFRGNLVIHQSSNKNSLNKFTQPRRGSVAFPMRFVFSGSGHVHFAGCPRHPLVFGRT